MNRLRWIGALAALWLGASRVSAQDDEAKKPTKLTLSPAKVATPALRYALLPHVRYTQPGNAALIYLRAFANEEQQRLRELETEKTHKLLDAPLDQIPLERLRALSNSPWALPQIDRAARSESCDWMMIERLRESGFGTLIPDVQRQRSMFHVLGVRTRRCLVEKDFDGAAHSLQTSFAYARHLNEMPFLISHLVALALVRDSLERVQEWVTRPDAPSLYWPLAELPNPLCDIRRAMQGDQIGMHSMFPDLRAMLDTRKLTPVDTNVLRRRLKSAQAMLGPVVGNPIDDVALAWLLAADHAHAKRFLADLEFDAAALDALPVTQVSMLAQLAAYDLFMDDLCKLVSLPYWEAQPLIVNYEKRLREAKAQFPQKAFIALLAVPAAKQILQANVRAQRQIAILRTIEAIRLHGSLPERLADLKGTPLPVDPMTGEPFRYRKNGDVGELETAPVPGQVNDPSSRRYELRFRTAGAK